MDLPVLAQYLHFKKLHFWNKIKDQELIPLQLPCFEWVDGLGR